MSDGPLHPTRTIERYSQSPVFRALVTAIPYIGGSIDALFGQWGAEIAQRRLSTFLEELAKETARLTLRRSIRHSWKVRSSWISSHIPLERQPAAVTVKK